MRIARVTPEAKRDLQDIWVYIATNDYEAADRVSNEIHEEFKKLAAHPGMGHMRQDISNTQYRVWKIYSYLIIYSYTDSELAVIRIIHGARDVGSIIG